MPNHVINRITFTCDGDRLQQILSEICYDQRDEAEYGPGTLDFNKLKPMPKSLSIESGTSTTDGINLYLTAVNPSGAELGLKKLSNEEFQKLLSAFQGTSRFWSYNAELTLDEVSKCTSYSPTQTVIKEDRNGSFLPQMKRNGPIFRQITECRVVLYIIQSILL